MSSTRSRGVFPACHTARTSCCAGKTGAPGAARPAGASRLARCGRPAMFVCLAVILLAACTLNVDLPRRYALIYGVAEYSDTGIGDLEYTDDDAEDMAVLLGRKGYDVTFTRTNADATLDQFESDVAELAATLQPSDRLFVYLSGHGLGNGQTEEYIGSSIPGYLADLDSAGEPYGQFSADEYFFFYGAMPWSGDDSIAEGISDDKLRTLLTTIPARQKIVVMDACHSGGFVGAGAFQDTVPQDYQGTAAGVGLGDLGAAITLGLRGPLWSDAPSGGVGTDLPGSQFFALTAAGERDFSWETSGLENGVFTEYFMEAASHGDANHDGHVTLSEAYMWAARRIEEEFNEIVVSVTGQSNDQFLPRLSGSTVDVVLFEAD